MTRVMTKWIAAMAVLAAMAGTSAPMAYAAPPAPAAPAPAEGVAPNGVTIPPGFRDWKLVTVAREEGKNDDIRAILGNDVAIRAMQLGKYPLPDGTVLARLAWSYSPLEESAAAFGKAQSHVAGHEKNGVQFMVKDSVKYASTGGWGYAEFDSGKPAGNPQACFACHTVVKNRDYVFNRFATVDTGGIGQ
ncbi:cytochrome P460 family protein [Cupriavidus pauculus]|uniref:cytochrome P460 family protein n=1 Tax=Cupriavidus pauculus TaxID=82633 RepID=UPI001EE20722|nr:cytochrome P460 family protein [Cupriavidus pauculus]GJG95852.1 cytochrome P460 family protein [Cupriavidus pauculus]